MSERVTPPPAAEQGAPADADAATRPLCGDLAVRVLNCLITQAEISACRELIMDMRVCARAQRIKTFDIVDEYSDDGHPR